MRVGVIGLSRGLHLAGRARRLGMEVAAACDRDAARREAATYPFAHVLLRPRTPLPRTSSTTRMSA